MSSDNHSELKRPAGGVRDLTEAGLAILSEHGIEGLTLRKVARRVGVSHAAPTHHFNGLPALLGSICAVGFQGLTQAMARKRQAARDRPRDVLIAICDGYVDYATQHPDLMRRMFNAPPGAVDDTELADAASDAYCELHLACAPFKSVSDAPDSTEALVWSLVHGLALLRIGGRFDNPSRVTAYCRPCLCVRLWGLL